MINIFLKYSIRSLLYGGGFTILFLVTLVFLMKERHKDKVFKPVSFVILGILSITTLWNSTKICAALAMKSDISSVQSFIENAINIAGLDRSLTVDHPKTIELFQEAVSRYPILNYSIIQHNLNLSNQPLAEWSSTTCNALKGYLNGIIIKSFLWLLSFIVASIIIVLKTMGNKTSRPSALRKSRNNDDF